MVGLRGNTILTSDVLVVVNVDFGENDLAWLRFALC